MTEAANYSLGRFVILSMSVDGTARVQGRHTHAALEDAVGSASKLLRSVGYAQGLYIAQIVDALRLDPYPAIVKESDLT